ncbi:FeoB-associated Cys-rich membrane protein [Aquimarina sp. 2201CG5-10]|uniref:FeoB-associated Cys-rich membrane protein n=1 Tax=Aquimarina callyspongiae TaxID=3098150 RepID=UPI002AB3C5DB|nr:FeoB-associated Cys-rich membrane protein [Aquimarina sp. 2201CG5-10]MDY8137045.1 FeoB-associated Cys-rich membrane protein [Aquimarina sp. 2201CG5-10]
MNILIQNIIVLLIFAIAVGFLIKKFFWKPAFLSSKKKSDSSCDSTCGGCH